MNNNINFCGKADRLIAEIIEAPKTPRAFKTKDYITVIESLGYKHERTVGSHFHYLNELGERITFKGNESTIDPNMVKELRQQIKKGKLDIRI